MPFNTPDTVSAEVCAALSSELGRNAAVRDRGQSHNDRSDDTLRQDARTLMNRLLANQPPLVIGYATDKWMEGYKSWMAQTKPK